MRGSQLFPADSLWRHRHLIVRMAWREVVGRYRGSVMGVLWTFLNPVFMLTIYTFVFSVIFQAKWGAIGNSKSEFAIILFSGLIVFNLFAETVGRAPTLILSNVNYVKKVVFPLEVLPVVTVLAASFHGVVSVLVLLAFKLSVGGSIPPTVLLLPVVLFPLLLLTMGVAWFLASLGVYLRDVAQTVGLLVSALMFMSPIFFPISAIPERFRPLMHVNPLTFIIEQTREVLLFGHLPSWSGLALYGVVSVFSATLGFIWFQKTRRGFADVL